MPDREQVKDQEQGVRARRSEGSRLPGQPGQGVHCSLLTTALPAAAPRALLSPAQQGQKKKKRALDKRNSSGPCRKGSALECHSKTRKKRATYVLMWFYSHQRGCFQDVVRQDGTLRGDLVWGAAAPNNVSVFSYYEKCQEITNNKYTRKGRKNRLGNLLSSLKSSRWQPKPRCLLKFSGKRGWCFHFTFQSCVHSNPDWTKAWEIGAVFHWQFIPYNINTCFLYLNLSILLVLHFTWFILKNQNVHLRLINNPQNILYLNSHYATPIPKIENMNSQIHLQITGPHCTWGTVLGPGDMETASKTSISLHSSLATSLAEPFLFAVLFCFVFLIDFG